MSQLTLGTSTFALDTNESVLDCLLRHEQPIAWACRSGVCQSCLVKAVKGSAAAKATAGLKATLQAGGYALACQWVPETDVEISLPGTAESAVEVTIAQMDLLNADVMRVLLKPTQPESMFASIPGQYLNLINPAGISRSYSIANDFNQDGYVELHVANTAQGLMSSWIFQEARPGTVLYARGPAGACFYVADAEQHFPLLLAGTGTGLAPLYGIIHAALAQGHKGPITLLQGGSTPERLYYVNELSELQTQHPNFHYQALVLNNTGRITRFKQGDLGEQLLASIDPARLKETRVYLCGAPDFVHALRKRVFLRGVSSAHIYCDAFVTRAVVTPAQ